MTKQIENGVKVDLSISCEIWTNGKPGDARVSLWSDDKKIWCETNGGPFAGDSMIDLLIVEGADVQYSVYCNTYSDGAKNPTTYDDAISAGEKLRELTADADTRNAWIECQVRTADYGMFVLAENVESYR